jgi:hypothetical protein
VRVVKLGKRQYAFELVWTPLEERNPSEAARTDIPLEDEVESGNAPVWTSMSRGSGSGSSGVLGWGSIEPGMPRQVFSYAEALARNCESGIYVAPIDDEHIWYVVISDGMPVPGTDVARPNEQARQVISAMAQQHGLRVLTASGSDVFIPDSSEFDPERSVARAKISTMRRATGSSKSLVAVAILCCVVIGFCVSVKMLFFPKKNVPDAATIAGQERAAYVAAAQGAMVARTLPADAGWAVTAFDRSKAAFLNGLGGMRLEHVVCDSVACTATYRPQAAEAPPLMEALKERVGKRLRFDSTGAALLSIELPTVEKVLWDEARITDPVRDQTSAQQVAADTLANFFAVDVALPELSEIARMPPNLGTAVIFIETLTVTARFPEVVQLKGLAALYARADFVPVRLEYTNDQFRVDFSRYIGGAEQ